MIFYSRKINKIKGIKSFFFSRNNGQSKGIYKSLNCGIGSNDKKKNVINNIKIVAKKINSKFSNLILLRQHHSNKIINFDNFLIKKRYKADGIITSVPKFSLGILTADCVPILVADKENKIIAAIHSGWKGANSGIIENLIKNANFEFIEHDVRIPYEADVDAILNFACPASPIAYQKDPVRTIETNFLGMINLLRLANKTGA